MFASGRRLSLIVVTPASPILEKFLGYGEEDSKILYLAETSSNNFSRADPQISEVGVSCRPIRDSGGICIRSRVPNFIRSLERVVSNRDEQCYFVGYRYTSH